MIFNDLPPEWLNENERYIIQSSCPGVFLCELNKGGNPPLLPTGFDYLPRGISDSVSI